MANSPYICPETKQPLSKLAPTEIKSLEALVKGNKVFSKHPLPEKIEAALGASDRKRFYVLRKNIPNLMPDAAIVADSDALPSGGDVKAELKEIEEEAALYDKIAEEMNQKGTLGQFGEKLRPGVEIGDNERKNFPKPLELWLDAPIALTAQEKAYEWIAPLGGKTVLQMGGHGSHAIKFLLAGAKEAYLISPSLEELVLGVNLAKKFGVGDGFRPVQGIAEKFPFENNMFDGIYGGGCLHHTRLKHSTDEIHRILKPGGKAAFVEPRMTLWYYYGRKLMPNRGLGDIEKFVQGDRPLYQAEIDAFTAAFSANDHYYSRVLTHIPLTVANRYIHFDLPLMTIRRIELADGAIAGILPIIRRAAPIISIRVEK